MNRIAVVALVALGLTAASAACAGTDQQKFDSLIRKHASENPFNSTPPRFKPKSACVCTDSLHPDYPGFLVRTDPVVQCGLPVFTPDGSILRFDTCLQFEVLGK